MASKSFPTQPAVVRIAIHDPRTGARVRVLGDRDVIDRGTMPAGATLVADVGNGTGSVTFELNGIALRTESTPPLCISGDVNGVLNPFDGLTPGPHLLRVTPFAGAGGAGASGAVLQILFAICGGVAATPMDPPASPPTSEDPATDPPTPAPPTSGGPPNPPPDTDDGWIDFPLAPGARRIHVASDGDDARPGDAPDRAVRTIHRGYALLRDGAGDQLLLRRGDTFIAPVLGWSISGKPGFPALIGAYGDERLPRPRWLAKGTGIDVRASCHDIAFAHFELVSALRDPSVPDFNAGAPDGDAGIRIVAEVRDVRLEGLLVRCFPDNLVVHAPNIHDPPRLLERVTLFRCTIADAWSRRTFGGQGIFAANVDGLSILECNFVHNGWTDVVRGAGRSIFRHNGYISEQGNRNVVARDNVLIDGSSLNLQCRCGATIENNFSLGPAVHLLTAKDAARIAGNVCVGGAGTSQQPDIRLGIVAASVECEVTNNLLVGSGASNAPYAGAAIEIGRLDKYTGKGGLKVVVARNIVHAWAGAGVNVGTPVESLELVDNVIQRVHGPIVAMRANVKRFAARGNRYDRAGDAKAGFVHPTAEKGCAIDRWAELSGDPSTLQRVHFVDSEILASWDAAEFTARVRQQRRGKWDQRYTAAAARKVFREAFAEKRA